MEQTRATASVTAAFDKSVTLRRERIKHLDASGFPVSSDRDGERVVYETRIGKSCRGTFATTLTESYRLSRGFIVNHSVYRTGIPST
ncbi:hypothetical protein EYF80_033856 [Liparis tanakae]|uniref:Uncharacterized protein n=1 Tax=Liparis tanakae TaxID=230148 RepID=A0A4Z2GRN8_9TELE|nr:hypothetical protein EYF80_033856 [Liparis tanakae]